MILPMVLYSVFTTFWAKKYYIILVVVKVACLPKLLSLFLELIGILAFRSELILCSSDIS